MMVFFPQSDRMCAKYQTIRIVLYMYVETMGKKEKIYSVNGIFLDDFQYSHTLE